MDNLNFFGKDAEFEHIGIVVKSINDTLKNVKKISDPIQKVSVAMVNINNFKVELVEPLCESSPVTNILKKGQTIYHICFKVDNIKIAIDTARKSGFHCIAAPIQAVAFKNKKIAWLFSNTYGLVELLEK